MKNFIELSMPGWSCFYYPTPDDHSLSRQLGKLRLECDLGHRQFTLDIWENSFWIDQTSTHFQSIQFSKNLLDLIAWIQEKKPVLEQPVTV